MTGTLDHYNIYLAGIHDVLTPAEVRELHAKINRMEKAGENVQGSGDGNCDLHHDTGACDAGSARGGMDSAEVKDDG